MTQSEQDMAKVASFRDALRTSERIIAVCGAGLSAASGEWTKLAEVEC